MALDVLARAAVKRYRFAIDGHPRALQACLGFEAYGCFPLRGLHFRFYDPAGALVHEVRPVPGYIAGSDLLSRVRRRSLGLRLECMVRRLLRANVSLHLDLPPACLAFAELSMSVENASAQPLAVGSFRLSTSTLAPDRLEQNRHAIEGYADRPSVVPGETLQLFVHAPLQRFALEVIRLGAPDRTVLHIGGIEGKAQDYAANAYESGAKWEPTFALATGPDWRSGMYVARVSDGSGSAFDITFIVSKPGRAASAGLAVLASTNTWQAYNDWGGASLYRYAAGDGLRKSYGSKVHMQRPNPAAAVAGDDGHLADAEKHVLRWLEQDGWAYDLYADLDLHEDPGLLRQYHTLLINTHSEYWTDDMYSGLEDFLDGGGNLLYLSGNGLYWKAEIRGQQLEVKCNGSSHSFSGEAGGRWRDCGRPEARVLGVRYTRAGYKAAYMPYRVISPGHWIFDGTGVAKHSLVGQSGVNMGGASGWEMDKLDRRARPAGLVHLAKGTNPWRSGADMTYFTHAGGGGVFAAGSITFGGSLLVDPVLGRMLRNLLSRFSGQTTDAAAARGAVTANMQAAQAPQE